VFQSVPSFRSLQRWLSAACRYLFAAGVGGHAHSAASPRIRKSPPPGSERLRAPGRRHHHDVTDDAIFMSTSRRSHVYCSQDISQLREMIPCRGASPDRPPASSSSRRTIRLIHPLCEEWSGLRLGPLIKPPASRPNPKYYWPRAEQAVLLRNFPSSPIVKNCVAMQWVPPKRRRRSTYADDRFCWSCLSLHAAAYKSKDCRPKSRHPRLLTRSLPCRRSRSHAAYSQDTPSTSHPAVLLLDVESRLKTLFASRPGGVLFIDGAPELEYADVASLIDIARGAGVYRIGLITQYELPES